ncbi:MAG: hypothetical protein LQ340_007773 [Diploschistes diacapsis]|nr:MAG: hypothetical protein LQ340_007773 [Diploschistes diacapsis]
MQMLSILDFADGRPLRLQRLWPLPPSSATLTASVCSPPHPPTPPPLASRSFTAPTPSLKPPFDTYRVATAMLYAGVFRRYPHITFVLAHCGGALAVAARNGALGAESGGLDARGDREPAGEAVGRYGGDAEDEIDAGCEDGGVGEGGAWDELWRAMLDGGDDGGE